MSAGELPQPSEPKRQPPPPATKPPKETNNNPSDLILTGTVGGAVLLTIVFWAVVLLLPEVKPATVSTGIWIIAGVLFVLALAGFVLAFLAHHFPDRDGITVVGAFSLFGFCALLGFLIVGTNTGFITVTAILKYALAVGGTALASFVVGLVLFDTIRAAASVPIVVLFLGTATFPAPLPELAAIRPTLITWMGVIIGAAAVAESANQIAGKIQQSKVAQTVVATAGSAGLQKPEELKSVVEQVVATEPGDLATKVG
jgi:hypothetical protein